MAFFKSKNQRTKNIRRFAVIVGALAGSFLLISSIAVFFYLQSALADSTPDPRPSGGSGTVNAASPAQPNESNGGFIANLLLPPERTNFLIAGVDDGDMLTDVVLVGTFKRDTQEITMLSIPRDTRITMAREDILELNERGRFPPSHGVMRINAIASHAGRNHGMEFLQKHVERMLDIEIDYHALVDLRAFRNIVDAVGGIYMDIRPQGLFYDDPYQNLHIRVPGGRQKLDGQTAEWVVRFRSYPQADLERINVQHEFMKQFFSQVINRETIMSNLGPFLRTIISYVRTDFGALDIPLYIRYAASLNADNITFHTLPGFAPPFAEGEASYFIYNVEQTAELAQKIFHNGGDEEDEPAETDADVQGLRVQLLNGGAVAEDFEELARKLRAAGAAVLETGDYTGSRTGTQVLARTSDMFAPFRPYLPDMAGDLNAGISQRFDAVIIVGP
ncbi:MAG: LCP family protein [Defluviitaleaceae bacterium]|nr:LCP family protein [Defluviitaleaceae bacterium]